MAAAELALAQRFKQLASDYDNRPVVVKRGTVSSVMRFMQHSDWQVRHAAAETILLLAQHPDNREPLCREKGFLELLIDLYRNCEQEDPQLYSVYGSVIEELRPVLESNNEENIPTGPAVDNGSVRTVKNRPTRVRQGMSVSRSLTLSVSNLSPVTQDELEDLLQTIRGVISYTVDATAKEVRLFLSAQTSAVTLVLQDGGFQVEVISDTTVENTADGAAENEAPRSLPSYRQRPGFGAQMNIFGSVDWKRTLVLHGLEGNSLQARLEKQKEERARKHQQEKNAISSLFGKLKSWW